MNFNASELLKENKRIIGPVILFVLSFFILLRVVIPLISSISDEQDTISNGRKRLQNLNSTYTSILAINQDNVENNINLVQTALPQTKDIILIYSTILDVAAKNNTTVESFAVKVGQIYSKEGGEDTSAPLTKNEFPNLQVQVKLTSQDPKKLFDFSKQIMQVLPLSQVDSVATDEDTGTYDISFYYKPLNAAALSKIELVTPLNASEQQTLKTIQGFEQN